MSENTIEYFHATIGGKKFEIECKYRTVFNLCRHYLSKFDSADIVLPLVTQAELDAEQAAAAETDIAEGNEPQQRSEASLETLVVCRKLSEALLDEGFLLFHGAAIAAGGKCYLFMAQSGTGKTTHIRKWLKLHPDTFVVNGDKPLIDIPKRLVYGTPWCGKEGMQTNTSVPLGGLIWLKRGEENSIEPLSFSQMLPCLMRQCHIPANATVKVVRLLGQLQNVPCWVLKCNMDDEAGEVSYNALVGQVET